MENGNERFAGFNSPESVGRGYTGNKYAVGKVDGTGLWINDTTRSGWTMEGDLCSRFDYATAVAHVNAKGAGFVVIDLSSMEPVIPPQTKPVEVAALPKSEWGIEFKDISGRTANPATKGVCIRVTTPKVSGFIQTRDENRRVVVLVPLAYAHAFRTLELASDFTRPFRNGKERFATELAPISLTAVNPQGDVL